VAIRLDEQGDVVVGKASAKAEEPTQPWPGLLAILEVHLGEVADLLAAGMAAHFDHEPACLVVRVRVRTGLFLYERHATV
jgi:hypothetical protein